MEAAAKEQKKIFCTSCGIDCTRLRFHYAKSTPVTANANSTEIKYDLCPNCYVSGRLPSSHQASDFVKLEDPQYTTIPDKTAAWTESEVLLLLEGLEQFDDNWGLIAKHVGTRTRQECVVKFLNLPIEDTYIEKESEYNNASMRALNGRMPVTQEDNPILSVVSFLAQTVDRSVAAAAAGKTVEAIRLELKKQIEKGFGGPTSAAKPKAPVKAEISNDATDSMDVDATATDSVVVADSDGPTPQNNSIGVMISSFGAAKSGALFSHEERNQINVVGSGTNLVLMKSELKETQLTAMEEALQAERRDIERVRQDLYQDRMALKTRVEEVERELRAALARGGEEGLRMVQEANSAEIGGRFGGDGTVESGIEVKGNTGEAVEF
jgi:SWI/SNF related-matrix-associated actin-dependent regulator of chromatin subfamily C